MDVIESELRERYRDASDEELSSLAGQGESQFTDVAWTLLHEELTRRGLPPAPEPQPSPIAEEPPANWDAGERPPAELPLARWGEQPDATAPQGVEALSSEDLPQDAEVEAPAQARQVTALTFTGRGSEYFRIWVVNLLLTLVTLGVYSAWAKVRKARYFRQNTRLDGHVFDYHGNPVAILRGRLVAVGLLAAYTWAFQFSRAAGLLTVGVLCAVGPWLFMRAQQFSLGNTSFRGLRFGFRGHAPEAYRTLLPVLILWLAPAVVAGLAIDRDWLLGIPGLALPWMHHRVKAYQRRNATYGDREFSFTPATGSFYWVYVKGIGFVFLGGVLVAVTMAVLLAAQAQSGRTIGASRLEVVIYGGLVVLLTYIAAGPYYAARLQQVVWSRTRLGEGIQFRTEIQALPLFGLVMKNVALTVVTAGLYWPCAAIALARYRIECVRVESDIALSALAGGFQAGTVSAAGEGAADAFGFDIGL